MNKAALSHLYTPVSVHQKHSRHNFLSSSDPILTEKTPQTTSTIPFAKGNNDHSETQQHHRSEVKLRSVLLLSQKQEAKRLKISQKEQKRLKGLADFLKKPGTTQWLGTSSGSRLNQLKTTFPDSQVCTPINIPDWDPINGYTGPIFKRQPIFFDQKRPKETEFTRTCLKVTPRNDLYTASHVLTYLFLRDKGCPRGDAMKFSSKQRCAIDSTQKYDGPVSMRVMRRVNNSSEGVVTNGWQFHSPEYVLSSEYKKYKPVQLYEEDEKFTQKLEGFEKRFRIEKGTLVESNRANIQVKDTEVPSICEKDENYSGSEYYDVHEEIEVKPQELLQDNHRKREKVKGLSQALLTHRQTNSENIITASDDIDYVIDNSHSRMEIRSIKPAKCNKCLQGRPVCIMSEINANNDNQQPSKTPKVSLKSQPGPKIIIKAQRKNYVNYRQSSLSTYDIMQIQLLEKLKKSAKKIRINMLNSQERKLRLDKQKEIAYLNNHEERRKRRLHAQERRVEIHHQFRRKNQENTSTYNDKIEKMRIWKESEEQKRQTNILKYTESKELSATGRRRRSEQQRSDEFSTRKLTRELSVELARFLTRA